MSNAPDNAADVTVELRWSDQDMFGHINNARILTIIEEARVRILGGLFQADEQDAKPALVVRKMETEFFLPLMYPEPVVIRIWVSHIGNSSFVMHHEVSQHSRVCVTCEAVMVIFSLEDQSAITIPDEIRQRLSQIAA